MFTLEQKKFCESGVGGKRRDLFFCTLIASKCNKMNHYSNIFAISLKGTFFLNYLKSVDQRVLRFFSLRASMPGNLPNSKNSKEAPPPVERCEKCSSSCKE